MQEEMDRWWSPRFDWTAWKETLFVGYFFEEVNKEVKERAYAELAEYFDSSSAIVKAKINVLRVKYSQEMTKELKTKSGQVTDTKNVSKWMFYEQLKFLWPVMATAKRWNSISTQNNNLDDSVSFPENEPPLKLPLLREN